jgi:hypothetical protein
VDVDQDIVLGRLRFRGFAQLQVIRARKVATQNSSHLFSMGHGGPYSSRFSVQPRRGR